MAASPKSEQDRTAEDSLVIQKRIRRVRNISIFAISLLFLQYVLGMTTNLFVEFPAEKASTNPLDSVFTSGPYLVAFHIIVGVALGLLSISALVLAARSRNRPLILIALSGLGAILFAGEAGIEFVLGWYSDDLFSFVMSLGFILSFIVYFLLLWFANKSALGVRPRDGELA